MPTLHTNTHIPLIIFLLRLFLHINRLFLQPFIFQFSFITKTPNMPGGCSSRHSGERIEVAFRHKVVRSEEFLQSFVNLFRGQWLLQYIPLFQRQDFNVAYLASQCHVGTKGDAFQLYLGAFPFGIHLHRFSAGQRRAKIADAIQVHLASFTQFPSHEVRQGIEHGQNIRFGQRTIFLYEPSQRGSVRGAVQPDARVQGQFFVLTLFVFLDSRTNQIISPLFFCYCIPRFQ